MVFRWLPSMESLWRRFSGTSRVDGVTWMDKSGDGRAAKQRSRAGVGVCMERQGQS